MQNRNISLPWVGTENEGKRKGKRRRKDNNDNDNRNELVNDDNDGGVR
jgi:hypothetical protein